MERNSPRKRKLPKLKTVTMCKNCENAEFFWYVFSRIWTEYGEIRRFTG